MRVYITGQANDTKSASGVGLAQAIRRAYPHAHLVGVNYAPLGTRIQWADFDEQWDVGPWNSQDFTEYQRQIQERLDDDAWWISAMSREIEWLVATLVGHERILAPPVQALERIHSPATLLAEELGMSAPATLLFTASDWDLNTFGRRHGWRIWLRSHDGSSQQIHSWQALQQARSDLFSQAVADSAFLQQYIEGTPESLAFSAYHGELLECALSIVDVTASEDTWRASRVEETPAPMVASLADFLKRAHWTGGGTLSLLRDRAERRWLLGCQAAFPMWIFGAALAGRNLPARLLERATGEIAMSSSETTNQFMRIVIDVPLHAPVDTRPTLTQAPSATEHDFALQRQQALAASNRAAPQISDEVVADVTTIAEFGETPRWFFLPNAARRAFLHAGNLMRRFSTPELQVQVAYSVKTNPDQPLLELACASGLLAETISQAEVAKALASGFPAGRLILNGPAKFWPKPIVTQEPLHAIYCDSLEELRSVVASHEAGGSSTYQAEILGIRLRALGHASRFGISIETAESMIEVAALAQRLPAASRFGIQFHMASNSIGLDEWWRLFSRIVEAAQSIEMASGRRVASLDVGGGWFPDDWTAELSAHLEDRVIPRVTRALPHVRELFLEPGRALAQSSMALAVRVIEVRREPSGRIGDVVVDGSIAEIAYHNYTVFPHRILWRDSLEQCWRSVGRGTARILGRLCMEKDILAEAIDAPETLAAGDLFVFCDVGAYDRSMYYSFGRG
jgi:diaminopimelate decarboxylase